MRMWWLLLGLVVAAWGCVDSSSVQCGDILCPEKTECRALTAPDEQICATQTQIDQCTGKLENDTCDAGWCHDGVCLPIVCGNNRVDHGEVCDDGNTITGDGTCSGDCASDETCGNGVVDPLKLGMMGNKETNEQCDDGNFVTGDGCSSTCLRETMRWQQLDPNPPPAMLGVSMAYDATRRRTVMFGGRQIVAGKDVSSGETYEWNGIGWAHIPTTNAPTPRLLAGLYYDPVLRRTVLFGGMTGDDNDPAFTDMWQWDGRDWTIVPAPAVLPPRRSRFGLAYDGKRKVAVLFGGFDINGPRSDTWEWDGTTWKENTSATHPPAQYSHVMVYDPKRSVIVMAGGSATPKETWEYDGAWHKITTATTPDDIDRSAATYSPQLGKVIVTGGFSSSTGQSQTTYAYNGTTWTDLAAQGLSSPREEVAMCADPNTSLIVMYGGLNTTTPLDEVWSYEPSRNTWSAMRAQGAPPPLLGATAAYDPATATAYVFGGVGAGGDSAELWTYDGVVWTSFVGAGPVPRKYAGLAYDIDRHRLVMFGGSAGGGTGGTPVPAETWYWQNGWTNANLTGPGQRAFAAMTYDTRRHHTVLYGGVDTNGLLGDAWELDGTSWTPKGNVPPGQRGGASSTFDLSGSRLVLANGQNMSGGPFSDAWVYDTAWTQVTMQTPFEARFIATMASDGARGSVLLFGGASAGGGVFDDLWELHGATWTRIDAGAHPVGRAGHASFPARNGDGIIVFGGATRVESAQTALNDVWQLESTSASPREICTDAKLDNDGDGLAGCADPDCWASCSPLCPPGTTCDPSEPRCGDAQCNPFLETCRSCPADCGACTAICGDAYCDPGETAAACPGDCP